MDAGGNTIGPYHQSPASVPIDLSMPSLELEESICAEIGSGLIAGLDEAGRGAIAGPVVAAAVILPLDQPEKLEQLSEVDDSKKLSPKVRDRLYDLVVDLALAYGVGASSAGEIDRYGIMGATRLAMRRASSQLSPQPTYLLIDGRIRLRDPALPQQSIIRGDGKSLTIAAASILAKVTRDKTMIDRQGEYPVYGFARHKGYCTPFHVRALDKHGPCPIHRRTFAPIRQTLV
mgnify:CR=1 FL=1